MSKKSNQMSAKNIQSHLAFGSDITSGIEELNNTKYINFLEKMNVFGDFPEFKKKANHGNDEMDDEYLERKNEDAKDYSDQSSILGEEEDSQKKLNSSSQKIPPNKSSLKQKSIQKTTAPPQINIVKFSADDNENYDASDSEDNNDEETSSNDIVAQDKGKKDAKAKKSEKSDFDEEEEEDDAGDDPDEEEMNDNLADFQNDEEYYSDHKKQDAANARKIRYDFDESKGPEQFLKVIAKDSENRIFKLSDLNYPYYEENDGSNEKKNNNYESLIEFAKKELEKSKFNEIYQKELDKKQSLFQTAFENELKPIIIQELNRKFNSSNQTVISVTGKGEDIADKKSHIINKFKFIKQIPEFKRKRPLDFEDKLKNKICSKEYFQDLKKCMLRNIRTNEKFSNKTIIPNSKYEVITHPQIDNKLKKRFTQINITESIDLEEETNFLSEKDFNKNIFRNHHFPTTSPMKSRRFNPNSGF